MFLADVKRL